MKDGQEVYIIENRLTIRKAKIVRLQGDFATIRFEDKTGPSGTRLRKTKLFENKEAAEKEVEKRSNAIQSPEVKKTGFNSPYDFMNL